MAIETSSFTYHGHSDKVFAVAWSPDGVSIASASRDNSVQIWNANTGEVTYTFYGHTSCLLSVAWSPDGKYIGSGSTDGIVQVWEATTGNNVVTYRGHARFVRGIDMVT